MNILAIGAHPDDLEILCGGTLALFSKGKNKVLMCHACDGSKGSIDHTSEKISAIRREEANQSAAIINAESIPGGFVDGEIILDLQSRIKMVNIIRYANPDVIITHHSSDYHTDHINVGRLVFDSVYLANVKLFKADYKSIDKLPILYYMDTLAGINFNPLEFVDISKTIEIKINMMLKMKSQVSFLEEIHDENIGEYIRTTARYRGYQAGASYAEGFIRHQIYPVPNIRRILP